VANGLYMIDCNGVDYLKNGNFRRNNIHATRKHNTTCLTHETYTINLLYFHQAIMHKMNFGPTTICVSLLVVSLLLGGSLFRISLAVEQNTPTLYNVYLKKALDLVRQKNYTEAIPYMDSALVINPNNTRLLDVKGITLSESRNYIEAIYTFDKVLAINSSDVTALNNKGIVLSDLGRYKDAISYYDRVLFIVHNDVDALNNKGNALGKLGRYDEARFCYDLAIEVIKSNSSYESSHIMRAVYVYTTSPNQDLNTAYIRVSDNITQNKIATIQMNLAEAYADSKNYKLAIVTYTEILHDNPYNGCALLGRADAYKKIGQLDSATRDETLGNMLHCSYVNLFKRPPATSQPDLITSLTAALFH
jgi:tetratricopeptide (TPR) repeat protein